MLPFSFSIFTTIYIKFQHVNSEKFAYFIHSTRQLSGLAYIFQQIEKHTD